MSRATNTAVTDTISDAVLGKHLRMLQVLPMTLHMRRHSTAEQLDSLAKSINDDSSGDYTFSPESMRILGPIYTLLTDWDEKLRKELDQDRYLLYIPSAFNTDTDPNTKPVKQLRHLALIISVFDKLLDSMSIPTSSAALAVAESRSPLQIGIEPSGSDEHQKQLRIAGILNWPESVMLFCNAWTETRTSFEIPSHSIRSDAELVMSLNKGAGRGQDARKVGAFQTSMCYVAMGIKALSMVRSYHHSGRVL